MPRWAGAAADREDGGPPCSAGGDEVDEVAFSCRPKLQVFPVGNEVSFW